MCHSLSPPEPCCEHQLYPLCSHQLSVDISIRLCLITGYRKTFRKYLGGRNTGRQWGGKDSPLTQSQRIASCQPSPTITAELLWKLTRTEEESQTSTKLKVTNTVTPVFFPMLFTEARSRFKKNNAFTVIYKIHRSIQPQEENKSPGFGCTKFVCKSSPSPEIRPPRQTSGLCLLPT